MRICCFKILLLCLQCIIYARKKNIIIRYRNIIEKCILSSALKLQSDTMGYKIDKSLDFNIFYWKYLTGNM